MRLLRYLSIFAAISITLLAQAEGQKLKVGLILPLTGGAAEYGAAVQNGFTLAKDSQPELFKDIQFVVEDSKFDGNGAVSAFNKLKSVDAVNLIYAWGAGPVQALVPIADRAKFPLIAATADESATEGKSKIIRVNYGSLEYSKTLMRALRSRGYKRLAIIEAKIPYYDLIISGMRKAAKMDESIDVISSFAPSVGDFKADITSFLRKSGSYDALGVFLVTGQISSFYQQAHVLKLKMQTFGTDFFESRDEIEKSGVEIYEAIYPGMNISKDFSAQYTKRFGTDVQIAYAGSAYDTALLIAQGYKRNPKDPFSAIKLQEHFSGVSGEYIFNSDTSGFDPQLVIKKISPKGIEVVNN